MLHHAHNHDQVDHQHEDNRNQCGLDKCIRIPDRVIRWQTVTVVIHRHNNIFKHRIAEYISDNRSQQCYNNRHGQIVPHQLSLRVTGRAQRSDRGGLFCNRIADRHGKDKCDDYHKDIQQHTAHGFVRKKIHGIAYLPEDRKVDGIVGDLSVRDNIILAAQVLRGFFRPFSKAQANKFADEYIKLLEIKTASADTPIKSLSGGNQQKVILARWLLTHPEYLILDEPTRGIDIGTKIEIQKLVLKLASEGMSVTFISSETDEMLRTCSRLIVMRDRRKVGEISGEDLTQSKIMDTIAGGEKKNG